jgi:hypothetical protein
MARSTVLGVQLSARVRFPDALPPEPGHLADWLRLPTSDALKLLRAVARLVADLPRDTDQDVVWAAGTNELLVHTGDLRLELTSGVVTIEIPVECDQVRGTQAVRVPLAVGTTSRPRGLMMATYAVPAGPPAITDVWADALTAFAWEALLTLSQHVAARAGKDRGGRALVPGAVGAERGTLLVRPMARSEA